MKNRHLPLLVLACLLSTAMAAWCQEGVDAALEAARQGRVAEALGRVDAVLADDPDDGRALFTRGVILAESGRRDDAEAVFRRLIELHPELPEAYNNLAVIQAAAGNFDDAVNTLKDALATNPSYQTAYENLTRIFAQLASEAYSRALEVDSPPAREEVDLQLLAALSSPAMPPATADPIAEAKLTPAEPMPAMPPEPTAEPSAPAAADPPEEVPAASIEPAPVSPAAVEGEDLAMEEMDEPAAVEEEAGGEDPAGEVGDLVDAWARAWSDQRVDDYLSFYADDFLPDNGMSRSAWESNRRERIGAPEFINVEVAILDSITDSSDRARVTFLQAYESDTYSDQVTKTLTLVRRDGAWKILEEKSGP